jgi:hypothetical protein
MNAIKSTIQGDNFIEHDATSSSGAAVDETGASIGLE